jgi:hypothetical protein
MRTCYRPRMLLRMIDRYPEICPYWNYTLPSLPTRNEENWAASVLKIPLLMPWMGAVERMVIRYSIFDMRESLELFTASQLHHIGDYQHRENLYCQLSYLYMKNITALTLSTIIVSRFVEVFSYKAAAHCTSTCVLSHALEFLFTVSKKAGFWAPATVVVNVQCYMCLTILAMFCNFWRERRRGGPSRFRSG